MMRGEIMFNRMSRRRRIALALPVIAVATVVAGSPVSAQQPAPAAKPAAPKPAAPKPAAAATTPAPAAPSIPGAPQPTLLGQYVDWGAYTATPGGKKVCFALAKPATSRTTPPNRPRDPAFIFISSRPAEKMMETSSFTFSAGREEMNMKAGSPSSSVMGSSPMPMPTSRSRARAMPCTPRPTVPG